MRPRWITILGVMAIIFGCFGLMTASQTLLLPKTLEFQRTALTAMQTEASKQPAGPDVSKMFEKLLPPVPGWFTPWSICVGLFSLAIAGLYVFGAIWLLLMKPSAPRMLCGAFFASMVASVVRSIGSIAAIGFMGLAMSMGASFGFAIDLILLLVLLAHRREWPDADPKASSSVT